jgi:MFS family permease
MKKPNKIQKEQKTIVSVALVTALCLLGDSMLYIALPIYWKEVGLLSLWEVGLVLSVNRLIRLPLNPFIGWLYSKIQLRTGLIIAVILTTVATTGYGFWNGLGIWLVLRCIWGLAWSLLRLGGYFTVLTYAQDHNRGHLMGTYNGLYRLGSLFGMLLGGFLPSMIGMQNMAFLFGFVTLVGIPLIFMFVTDKQTPEFTQNVSIKIFQMDGMSKTIARAIISGLLISLLFQGLLTSTLSYVIGHHYKQGIFIFGIAIGVTALAGMVQAARWIWEPFLASRFGRWSDGAKGRLPLFMSSLVVAALGFSLIPIKLPLFLWLIVIFLVMVSATSLTTLIDALTSDVAKSSPIKVMILYSVALDLGAAIGPFLGYLIISLEYGLFYTYIGGSIIFLYIAYLWYVPFRKH